MTEQDRRSQILAAALTCFLEKGYRATSIADIRAASGATTGSIYHFFAGKGSIAEALLREAVRGWSVFSDLTGTPEQQIKASVRGLVIWGLANPQLLRFMEEVRSLDLAGKDGNGLETLLDAGRETAAAAFAHMQSQGAVRKLPFSIAHALILGPAYSYLRSAPPTPPDQAERIATVFADAAWQAVKS
jgi:AcrR family transcriptional regulator